MMSTVTDTHRCVPRHTRMTDFFAATPGGAMLGFAVLLAIIGHIALSWAERHATPQRIESVGGSGALRKESPAVVNVLTNDATLTAAGIRATVVDLATRGWLRILPPLTDDETSRVRPSSEAYDGDALLPHERLVLQHILARFTTDQAIPARHLAVDIRGSWWRRFRNLVYAEARRSGLVTRRWTPLLLAGPAWSPPSSVCSRGTPGAMTEPRSPWSTRSSAV